MSKQVSGAVKKNLKTVNNCIAIRKMFIGILVFFKVSLSGHTCIISGFTVPSMQNMKKYSANSSTVAIETKAKIYKLKIRM